MTSIQVKGKETEELEQLYKKLEQDWHAIKQTHSTTASSRKYPSPSNTSIKKPIRQLDNFPRDLMSRFQQESSSSPEEAWNNVVMTRTKDLAMQEILQERREAIKSGKLKGRRLFHPMVDGSESDEKGPRREVKSMSFCYSEDEDEDESCGSKGLHGCTRESCYSSSLSSSSSCLVGASLYQEVKEVADIVEMVTKKRVASRPGNGRRYAVIVGGLAIALLMIAMCMSLARSSGGYDHDVILVPT